MTESTATQEWDILFNHFTPPIKDPQPLVSPTNCEFCNIELSLQKDGMVCSTCGYMKINNLNEAPEWRGGPSEDGSKPKQSSRCGAPQNSVLFSNQLGTMIKDKYPGFRSRLSKLQLRTINPKDRCLFHAYKHFTPANLQYGVPSTIVNRAKFIYKGISENKLTRGDKRKGIMGNCLLHALQENKVPRTTKEVAVMFGIDVRDITRMRTTFYDIAGEIIKTAKPDDLMSRVIMSFEFELRLRIKIIKRAGKHLEIVKKSKRLSGKTPSGIMAAVLWSVIKPLDLPLCEEAVAKASNVSKPTMVKLYHAIEDLFVKQ